MGLCLFTRLLSAIKQRKRQKDQREGKHVSKGEVVAFMAN